MHGFELLVTLAGGLTAALVCGYVTQRVGLSPLVGYLLAGILVGPFTPGFCGTRRRFDVPARRRSFPAKGEVALALIENVLRRLGATPDQIDRERERVHGELVR